MRCLVCRRDVKVVSRAFSAFAEHCRGVRHHRLDCLLRMQRDLPLRSQAGILLDSDDAEWQRELLAGMPVPEFETCPDLTVDEVLRIEATGSTIWSQISDREETRRRHVRLFVSMVIDTLSRDGDLSKVVNLWDSLVACDASYEDVLGARCTNEIVAVVCFVIFML